VSERPPRTALVIGYGSPIRGDDAVGPLVADRLQQESLPEGVSVIARHVLTADLVPDIAVSDLVIFLDAASEGEPGEVRCRRLHPSRAAVSTMAHFLEPTELLAWTQALYGRLPEAHLVTVAGKSFDFAHSQLSTAVAAAAESMLSTTRELIAQSPAAD
jgi:hydrogenase maturation protease